MKSQNSNSSIQTRIFTKVNPKVKFSQFSNLGSQILKKTFNMKPTILTNKIPHCEIDGINKILFRHSKLQKKLKTTFNNFSLSNSNLKKKSKLTTQRSKSNFKSQFQTTWGQYWEGEIVNL